mmetsp:Transcript_20071/g.44638  ORF Transcript_20071/g.44638 Transcript_20071/m.44638 type:complete len:202 (-) Transcript_20071:132-737(-)
MLVSLLADVRDYGFCRRTSDPPHDDGPDGRRRGRCAGRTVRRRPRPLRGPRVQQRRPKCGDGREQVPGPVALDASGGALGQRGRGVHRLVAMDRLSRPNQRPRRVAGLVGGGPGLHDPLADQVRTFLVVPRRRGGHYRAGRVGGLARSGEAGGAGGARRHLSGLEDARQVQDGREQRDGVGPSLHGEGLRVLAFGGGRGRW